MSYPPPPGTASSSLPSRPPPAAMNAFSRLAPRQVNAPATQAPAQAYAPPDYTGGGYTAAPYPATSYAAAPVVAAPHIVNPFPLPGQRKTGFFDLDPELQAQIAQQQSIYDPQSAENLKARAAPKAVVVDEGAVAGVGGKKGKGGAKIDKAPTVIRQGGGQTWTDNTLLEWDPSHFRLFVGNLAGEVTDDSLLKAFSKYPSVQKARVIRDKRTTKSKGFGFVAFSDGDEYFRAAREMQGKYIGSHPVLLKRSNTEIKPVIVGSGKTKGGRVEKNKKKKGKGHNERKVLG